MRILISNIRRSRARSWFQLIKGYLKRHPRPPAGPPPDHANVPYGDHPQQVLDFWHGAGDPASPAPVLIFFHGGALVRGRKFYSRLLREARERGVSVASVNYRLTRPRGITIEHAMEDAVNAVRLIRSRANEWRIDPSRVALTGNSAGGCLALWVAFRGKGPSTSDGVAPGILASDPSLSESIRCVSAYNALTSIDPDVLIDEIGGPPLHHYWPIWSSLFDITSMSALQSPPIRSLIETYSPLSQVPPDAPPIFLTYSVDPPAEGRHPGSDPCMICLHSPRYGQLLDARYREVEAPCLLSFPSRPAPISRLEFLLEHLLAP